MDANNINTLKNTKIHNNPGTVKYAKILIVFKILSPSVVSGLLETLKAFCISNTPSTRICSILVLRLIILVLRLK